MNYLAFLVCIVTSFGCGFIYGWVSGKCDKHRSLSGRSGKITGEAIRKINATIISKN